MIIKLLLQTLVLWVGLSAMSIALWRAFDNFAVLQGWWE